MQYSVRPPSSVGASLGVLYEAYHQNGIPQSFGGGAAQQLLTVPVAAEVYEIVHGF